QAVAPVGGRGAPAAPRRGGPADGGGGIFGAGARAAPLAHSGIGRAELTMTVDRYVAALVQAFRSAPSKHEAHLRSRPILADLSGDRAFLTEALGRHLARPGVLDERHYPVIAIE